MPDEPKRQKPPADQSPEDMMGDMAAGAAEDLPPPEDFPAGIQRPARPQDSPPPAAPAIDPLAAAAQPFLDMQNRAATLSELLRQEEISFDDYQRLLYDAMVQDEAGFWWMIDADNAEWYRHNPERKQWEREYPAALREYELAARDPDATLTQPDSAYDMPPHFQAPRAGAPITDERGVEIGRVPPTKDELYTVPGAAAFADELGEQQRAHEADLEQRSTVAAAPDGGGLVIPRAYTGDGGAEPAPIVRDLPESRRLRWALTLLAGLIMLSLVGLIVAAGVIMLWYRDQVEPFAAAIAALEDYQPAYQTARIFAADGSLIAAFNSQETGARTAVPLEAISPYMIHAIVSQENERFFDDPGFDPIAIARAFLQNLGGGGIESGASTITQQIARNLVLQDREVTVERKIKEILVALEIANRYDKNRILELYLNEIFFANQTYGVEAAANFYFGHGADQLNYAESALLASIVPFPLQNDPVTNRQVAIAGMRSTMRKMLKVGCLQFHHGDWRSRGPFCIRDGAVAQIHGGEAVLVRADESGAIIGGAAIVQIAEVETADFRAGEAFLRYPHFVDYVRAAAEAELGAEALFQRGINIYTTLNPALQDVAQAALSAQVRALTGIASGVNTGAVMVSEPGSGAIRALVGSHDYRDAIAGQVNNALTFQQPGSAIKPFVMMAALQDNDGRYLTPASIIWDVPLVEDLGAGGIYQPQNLDRRFHGPVSLRAALQNSYNIPTVKIFRDYVGVGRFANIAEALGLSFPPESFMSLASALGANEVRLFDLMGAYATLANGGARAPLYAIERITETISGQEREISRERPPPEPALSPALAYLMLNLLSDDAARAPGIPPGSNLTLMAMGIPTQNTVAAKTGTTNGGRDLWTMGFTRDAVVGVWLGTSDNSPTFNTSGYHSAAPVWNAVMSAVAELQPPLPFENPGGVVAREICKTTGTLHSPACPQPATELFLQEQYPPPPEAGFLQRAQVDSWSLLRANEFCSGHVIERNFADIAEAEALDWLNNSEAGRAYADALDLPRPVQPPPQAACSPGAEAPLFNISSPNAGAVLRGIVEVRGQAQAPDFDRFELLYARAEAPTDFFPISASLVQMPQYGSSLGTWDTYAAQIPDGNYILRLAAYSLTGGFINFDLPLRIDNSEYTPPAEPVFGPTVGEISTPTPGGG